MKRVTIREITLVNFKGIKSLNIKFGQDETEIRGANKTGKSTIMDAFNWVLFGKNAFGDSDSKFGIKTNDTEGNIIPKIDHEVTAVFDIDGQTVELRRILSEDWVTPRGKEEPELKGNSTAYFYNGVPLKESEYKGKINEIISEDLFRMITNPLYFPRLDWQVQREMLLRIAGGVTIEEIAAGRSEFSELLAKLSGKSLAEYKAEISARKKKLKEALDLIPARIDEVTRATPADYVQNEKTLLEEKTRLEGYLSNIDKAISDKAEAQRQQYESVRETQRQINDLKLKQQQIISDAKMAEQNRVNNQNAKRIELTQKFGNLKRISEQEENAFNISTERQINEIRKKNSEITTLENILSNLRTEWTKENEREYTATDINCPICGQTLPESMLLQKRELFEKDKADRLDKINKRGKSQKDQLEFDQKKLSELEISIYEKHDYSQELQELKNAIENTPEVTAKEINPDDFPEYTKANEQIEFLQKSIQETTNAPDNSELIANKRDLTASLDNIKQKLSLRTVIENNEKRKAELLKEEKKFAQQKADLEKQEFAADSLVKEQMNEVERRVNHKFSLVRFKMFSQQINGGEKPDCILLGTDGAKFMDTNSAGKIAMGLDIINTLCEFNGVCAPIFVDNAEGINQLLLVNSQLIKLIVTFDKELIIK
jgi:DNA repair exonuclease SbcCD ATPase subunit